MVAIGAPATVSDRAFVALAEVARPHGIRGELRLKIYNKDSTLLASRPKIRLRLPDGSLRDVAMTSAREVPGSMLVTLAGVDDRNAAEALRGAQLCVARDAFPPLDEGEFYACDLEGARVVLGAGDEIGKVTGIQSYPTCDALLVDRAGKKPLEVPLVEAYVASVDVERGVVELKTIEGLD